jgi:hypothetical protein
MELLRAGRAEQTSSVSYEFERDSRIGPDLRELIRRVTKLRYLALCHLFPILALLPMSKSDAGLRQPS